MKIDVQKRRAAYVVVDGFDCSVVLCDFLSSSSILICTKKETLGVLIFFNPQFSNHAVVTQYLVDVFFTILLLESKL